MLIYPRRYLKFIRLRHGLAYFDEPYDKVKADIIREWQYSKKRTLFSGDIHTLLIDLTKTEDDIFSGFDKITKRQIHSAKTKDAFTTVTFNNNSERGGGGEKNNFFVFFNAFALSKNLPPIGEEEFNFLFENNVYIIRGVLYNDEVLVYHSYITVNKRARLMHSASLFRNQTDTAFKNLIGRANRLLHWDDICFFKKNDYLIYDFGGISIDSKNQGIQAINKFKEGFGGTPVKEYKSYIPLTLKGLIFLLLKKII
ncbi:MAG: hypothetical protein FWG07_01380 [Treponema sp.]|nr:hypothetical protein [Treponema sp.]